MTSAVRCDDVRVVFGRQVAVDGASLDVEPGQWLGLIGPNGAGKSSLLGAIAGIHSFEGLIERAPGTPMDRRDVALVPQTPVIPEGMSVAEYVLLGRTAHLGWFETESRQDRDIVASVLCRLKLGSFADRPVAGLSGGEQQRVVVARALAHGAPVLLLDEPTSALDLGHQGAVLELIDELRQTEDLTVVAAMHDLTTAGRFADRLALIDAGRMVATGPPEEILRADLLSEVYATPLVVERVNGDLVVLPAPRSATRT